MTQFRPSSFPGLSTVIKNLLIINVLFFLAQNTIGQSGYIDLEDLFGLHHVKSPLFQPWQIITHLFLHGDKWHLFFNMLGLWMLGDQLENLWGSKKFLTFYFICGIGAALLHLTFLWFESSDMLNQLVSIKQSPTPFKIDSFFNEFISGRYRNASEVMTFYHSNPNDPQVLDQVIMYINACANEKINVPTIGASGAISGIFAAFLYLFPNTEFLLYFLFPIKAKWLGLIYFGREIYFAIVNSEGDNVAHWAHLGGALVGFLLVLTWNKNNRRTFY